MLECDRRKDIFGVGSDEDVLMNKYISILFGTPLVLLNPAAKVV